MAEAPDNPLPPDHDDDAGDSAREERSWSQIWQLPVLLIGLGLFIVGVYFALPEKKQDDFPSALEAVSKYIAAEELTTAYQMLKDIEKHMVRATVPDQARYEELFGDLVFHQQKAAKSDDAVNQELMLGYYRQSSQLGRPLDDLRLQRMAEALVSLEREEEALALLSKLNDAAPSRRYAVVRKLIDKRLASPNPDPAMVDKLLNSYLEEIAKEPDKALQRKLEIWAFSMKAKLMFDAGHHAGVIEMIERKKIALMDRGGDKDLAPLDIIRAQSYLQQGNFKVARDVFTQAQSRLPRSDALHADALVGLGKIELVQTDDIPAAWALFKEAEENYRPQETDPARAPYFEALLGRSDCEARMGKHTESLDHLAYAVKVMTESRNPPKDRREQLISIALSHHVAVTDLDLHETALQYLSVLTPLHGESVPAEWWALFAATHERIATKKLRDAGLPLPTEAAIPGGGAVAIDKPGNDPNATGPEPTKDTIRLVRQDAAKHFERAGDAHAQHAASVKTIDPKSAGDSWWAAAGAYDNAFQWKLAIRMYQEFIDNRGDDPRRIDATHKLGMAYLADKKYKEAIERFESLKQNHPTHKVTAMSLVPLSRGLVAMDKLDEAERVLLEVVTNHPAITPDSDEYREAQIALGRLYHQKKDYENAIQRLASAVDRFGDTAEGPALRFLLAESYRQSIPAIDRSLEEPLPQSKVREYQAERVRRLEQSLILHSQVVTELGEIDEKKLSPILQLYFRNAYFYRADCAFDLKRYEQAIELYDSAARRWRDHPSSLVALVQMVNSYAELGQHQNARAVNLRARDHLRRIPEEAFNDPSLPMTRKHWQDWLHWSSKLNLFDPQASADDGKK